jgi:hypothetical protein
MKRWYHWKTSFPNRDGGGIIRTFCGGGIALLGGAGEFVAEFDALHVAHGVGPLRDAHRTCRLEGRRRAGRARATVTIP